MDTYLNYSVLERRSTLTQIAEFMVVLATRLASGVSCQACWPDHRRLGNARRSPVNPPACGYLPGPILA